MCNQLDRGPVSSPIAAIPCGSSRRNETKESGVLATCTSVTTLPFSPRTQTAVLASHTSRPICGPLRPGERLRASSAAARSRSKRRSGSRRRPATRAKWTSARSRSPGPASRPGGRAGLSSKETEGSAGAPSIRCARRSSPGTATSTSAITARFPGPVPVTGPDLIRPLRMHRSVGSGRQGRCPAPLQSSAAVPPCSGNAGVSGRLFRDCRRASSQPLFARARSGSRRTRARWLGCRWE